jgi:hypothetical protein
VVEKIEAGTKSRDMEIKDKNGTAIKIGDLVLTDEAGWMGMAVRYGNHFGEYLDYTPDMLVLIDPKGGYSLEPNWKECEVVWPIGEVSPVLEDITEQKISAFLSLPKGWHYGKGGPISIPIVRQALQINRGAWLAGYKTDAFPGYDGEIQINCYRGDETKEFTIDRKPGQYICDNNIRYVLDIANEEVDRQEDLTVEQALEKL